MADTTLIRGGTLVSATGADPADVLVEGETIAAVFAPGSGAAERLADGSARVIDATGKYVLPGGVDCHTHMELDVGATVSSDTFATGTEAAAWGGTTTIVDFVTQEYGQSLHEALELRMAQAEGNCASETPRLSASTRRVTTARSPRFQTKFPPSIFRFSGAVLRPIEPAADVKPFSIQAASAALR